MEYYRIVRVNGDGTREELEIVAGLGNAQWMAQTYREDYLDNFIVVPYC